MQLNWLTKSELRGARGSERQYYLQNARRKRCTRKMLKETETLDFFITFLT